MTATIDTILGTEPTTHPCLLCGKPAVVLLNTTPACAEHIDQVMAQAFALMYRLIGRLIVEGKSHGVQ